MSALFLDAPRSIGSQSRSTVGWRSMGPLAVYGRFQLLTRAVGARFLHRPPKFLVLECGVL
jgi:hypothetical protein